METSFLRYLEGIPKEIFEFSKEELLGGPIYSTCNLNLH